MEKSLPNNNKFNNLFDETVGYINDYKSYLRLVAKLKQFVENPTFNETKISSIGVKIPRLTPWKEYKTNCSELSNFVDDFNKHNSVAQISIKDKIVTHIDTSFDKKNRKILYSIEDRRFPGVYDPKSL